MTSSWDLFDTITFLSFKIWNVFLLFIHLRKLNLFWGWCVIHITKHFSPKYEKLICNRNCKTMITSGWNLTNFCFEEFDLSRKFHISKISMTALSLIKFWTASAPSINLSRAIKRHWMMIPTINIDDMLTKKSFDEERLRQVFFKPTLFSFAQFIMQWATPWMNTSICH